MSSGWGFLNMQNTRENRWALASPSPTVENSHLGPILFGVQPSTAILSGYFKTKSSYCIILLINSSIFILVQKFFLKFITEATLESDSSPLQPDACSSPQLLDAQMYFTVWIRIQIGIWTLDSFNTVLHFLLINSKSPLLPYLLKNMTQVFYVLPTVEEELLFHFL